MKLLRLEFYISISNSRNYQKKSGHFLVYALASMNQDAYFIFLFFGFRQPITAPIATPTATRTGSLVVAKTAAPIAVPTPIQFPTLPEFLNFLLTS